MEPYGRKMNNLIDRHFRFYNINVMQTVVHKIQSLPPATGKATKISFENEYSETRLFCEKEEFTKINLFQSLLNGHGSRQKSPQNAKSEKFLSVQRIMCTFVPMRKHFRVAIYKLAKGWTKNQTREDQSYI